MSSDQKLHQAALAMIAAAEGRRPVIPVLRRLCPAIHRQLLSNCRSPGLLSLWGRCLNVDEIVGQTIVHPAILHAIGDLAGVPMRGRVVHAGLQHTYGYLFSLIETPYGRKRDRWVSTALERGLGIDPSLLGAQPRQGTLLGNVTWLLGQIAFRDQERRLKTLERSAKAVADELVHYDYRRLEVCRMIEEARTGTRHITAITDLVVLPHKHAANERETTLLVYSLQTGPRSPRRLITAFPVTSETAHNLRASVPAAGASGFRLRFNAYAAGWQGRTVMGRCTVVALLIFRY